LHERVIGQDEAVRLVAVAVLQARAGIKDPRRRLADRRIALELTEPARAVIARRGYDPVYGARPLRRYIQREVETRIGRALIAGEVGDGATVIVGVDGEELVVRWEQRAPEERAREVVGGAS
jgi:ATP-dependent Clp protease ATP-binding subunit ClpA